VPHTRRVFLALSFVAAACGDDHLSFPDYDGTVGDFTVHVDDDPARLEIRDADGRLLLDGLPGGFAFGSATAEIQFQFGAFKFEEMDRADTPAARVRAENDGAGGVALTFYDADDGELGTGTITAGAPGELVIALASARVADDRATIAFDCAAGEHFLGFGGQSYDVDHRGQRVPIWVQEDGIGKYPDDDYSFGDWLLVGRRHSTHTPMPMYVSSRGYGLALDGARRSVFDMCAARGDAVSVEHWAGAMELHLFAGPAPATVIDRMTQWTGRPAVPPAFAFAPWLDALYGSDNVRRVAQKLRDSGVPASVIWSEDWRGGNQEGDQYVLEEDWELDRELYPDFEQVAADLHAAGYKWLTYNNTFLDTTAGTYDEALAGGYTIHDASGGPYLFMGVKFNPSSLLDLSSPAARAWAKEKLRAGLVAGADGWMADFAEWLPHDAVLASGEDPMEAHNLYPVEWARLNQEVLAEQQAVDGVERLFFVRAAYVGSQPQVSVVWAGDQQTDFSEGDGFPSVIPMGIGLGVTGFPYYGHDIAGYMSQGTVPVSEELWYRWVTLGALSPVMRTHHGRQVYENWHWEKDAASTAHLARWATLHIRLYPYLARLAQAASATGMPIMRPLALAHPDFEPGWTATDTYMLGDMVYVAPIVKESAVSRQVALPPGTYYPLLGGPAVTVAAGETITVGASKEEIPAFVPAGAGLVLLPEGVDTLVDASAAGVTDLADAGDARELWLWPGGASQVDAELAWQADGLTGPLTGATWNGAPLPVAPGNVIQVTAAGAGTLVLNGGEATLTYGGAGARTFIVRVQGL
jgi:alpha-glucosidase (family GH31 glycosyl hydrolase)